MNIDAEAERLAEIADKRGTHEGVLELLKSNPTFAKMLYLLLEGTSNAKNFVALGYTLDGKAAFELIVHRAGGRMPSYKEICKVYSPGTVVPPRKDVCDNCGKQYGCCMYDHAKDEGIDKEWGCTEWGEE